MSQPKASLMTPIYIKPRTDTAWPKDAVFYMLTASGLFLCRNNPFYTSCVPTPRWPTELATQKSFLEVHYPKIARRLLELVVGYFDRVADEHGSEAAVLLAWNKRSEHVEIVVPEQVATISRNGWGDVFPVGVEYKIPANLAPDRTIIGDVHSHVDGAAYSSYVDKHDETYRAGLHIVVGRLGDEPPEFHIEAVTDGARFVVEPELILAGYHKRRVDVPDDWMEKITVKTYGRKYYDDDGWKDTKHTAANASGDWEKGKHYDDYAKPGSGYSSKDYGRADSGQATPGRANGDGRAGKHPSGFEKGHDPGDDDAPGPRANAGNDGHDDAVDHRTQKKTACHARDEEMIQCTIHREILDDLDKAASKRPPAEPSPPAQSQAAWKLQTDEVLRLGFEKPLPGTSQPEHPQEKDSDEQA